MSFAEDLREIANKACDENKSKARARADESYQTLKERAKEAAETGSFSLDVAVPDDLVDKQAYADRIAALAKGDNLVASYHRSPAGFGGRILSISWFGDDAA